MGNGSKNVTNPYSPTNALHVLSAEVSARVSGQEAFITLNVPKKKGLWPGIMQALLDHNIDVLNATLSTNGDNDFHCIHCKLHEDSELEVQDLESMFDNLMLSELRIRPCRVSD